MYEGEILGIQTKSEKVELKVVKADPAVRGNTSQTAKKKVVIEAMHSNFNTVEYYLKRGLRKAKNKIKFEKRY